MITVTLITNGGRLNIEANEYDTIRDILEREDVDYSVGVTAVDGCALKAGEMDKTLPDLGIYEKCYISVVVKADNAAHATVIGGAIVVSSAYPFKTLKTVQKYRPETLMLYEGEGDHKRRVFVLGADDACGGVIQPNKAVFSSIEDNAGNATITATYDPAEAECDKEEYIQDLIGTALLRINKVEANIEAALTDIEAEKKSVMDAVTFG